MVKQVRRSLSLKFFLILVFVIVLPMNFVVLIMKSRFEDYIAEEINSKITQTLRKSEQDLYETFYSLLNISNILVANENFRKIFSSDIDHYQRVKSFDNILSELSMVRMIQDDKIQVTFIDSRNDVYSNWSLNYNDYSLLIEQDWIKECTTMKGHIRWGLFSDPFIVEDDSSVRYINVARSVLKDYTKGELLGVLVISMRQKNLSEVLSKYAYSDNDCVYVCDQSGEVILKLDNEHRILDESETDIKYILEKNGKIKTIHNCKYLFSDYTLNSKWMMDGKTLSVYYFTDYEAITKQFGQIIRQMNLLILLTGAAIIFFTYFLSKRMVKPVKMLAEQLKGYDMNLESRETHLDIVRKDEIGELNRAFFKMNENIVTLFRAVEKEQQIKEQYRLNYLKAQLNPHFLFNTLNMIRWQAIFIHADHIVEAIDALGEMLQYSMGKGDEFVSLKEEVRNLEGYVKIQNSRYGKCYKIVNDIPEKIRELKIIRFILLPIVENSIIHGFRNTDIEGNIKIDARVERSDLLITVSDNGVGLTEAEIIKLNTHHSAIFEEECDVESRRFNKIGISNVNDQIKIRFGESFGLHFENCNEGGTRVIYRLPIVREGKGMDL